MPVSTFTVNEYSHVLVKITINNIECAVVIKNKKVVEFGFLGQISSYWETHKIILVPFEIRYKSE